MCDRHGVTCVYTSKLFFNRFTSSITINFPTDIREDYDDQVKQIRSKGYTAKEIDTKFKELNERYAQDRNKFINFIFDKFGSVFPEDAEYRMNKASVTFYHDDPTNMTSLISAFRSKIVKVTVPRNEDEIAFMRANTDKLIRDRYFLNEYPYRITFKNVEPHLDMFIKTQFGKDESPQEIDQARAYYYASSEPTLYLCDFDDVFLTKIAAPELIDKIEEVQLRK